MVPLSDKRKHALKRSKTERIEEKKIVQTAAKIKQDSVHIFVQMSTFRS